MRLGTLLMSALGQKRTVHLAMSAKCLKRTLVVFGGTTIARIDRSRANLSKLWLQLLRFDTNFGEHDCNWTEK